MLLSAGCAVGSSAGGRPDASGQPDATPADGSVQTDSRVDGALQPDASLEDAAQDAPVDAMDSAVPRDCTPAVTGRWRTLGTPVAVDHPLMDVGATVDGDPAILFINNAGELRVQAFDGANWVDLGGPLSTEAFFSPRLATGDALYALWSEDEPADGQDRPHVARWDGVAWSELGDGFGVGVPHTAYGDIAVGPSGEVVVVWGERPVGQSGSRRNMAVYQWSGSSWTSVGPILASDVSAGLPTVAFDGSAPVVTYASSNTAHVWRWAGGSWTEMPGSPVMNRTLFNPLIGFDSSMLIMAYAGPGAEITEAYLRRYDSGWRTVLGGVSENPGSTPAVPDDLTVSAMGRGAMLVRETDAGRTQQYRVYREDSLGTTASQVGGAFDGANSGRITTDGCDWLTVAFFEGSSDARSLRVARWEE